MKILVVDDTKAKSERLIEKLISIGIDRGEIDCSASANSARANLAARQYDLMILDLVLPQRDGEAADVKYSIELLRDVTDSEMYHKPGHILGLTAFDDAEIAANKHFTDMLWSVVKYDQTTADWAEPIVRSIRYIAARQSAPTAYDYDLCIVTALATPEMEAVHRLRWSWEPEEPMDDVNFARIGCFSSVGKSFRVVSACATRMGMISTALLSAKAIYKFRPRFLAMSGICAGVVGKANIGDVIFADPTWDWQSGKRVKDKENTQFSIAPHQLSPAEFLRSRVQQFANDRTVWDEIRNGWPASGPASPRLLLGPLVSGSAVLADGQVVEEIKLQHRSLLGVEMEAYGLFAAAANAEFPRPTPVAIKSVCDFADEDKSDDFQKYAAYTSAQALGRFFERYMAEISGFAGRT
jgi:nucleoside phosphorylase/CheY-like chemotaxis protein